MGQNSSKDLTRTAAEMPTLHEGMAADAAAPPSAANPAPSMPAIAGYELTERLGEGGMGTVWRARQLSTRREVALKLMSLASFGSERARQRFEREVEVTARLEHPNIARLYESGLDQGVFFFAMELIDGRPLDEHIQSKAMARREILGLMRRVCLAVQYAHQRGIIHRDLKPSNILVDDAGEPKLLDFGLAKAVQEGQASAAISLDGDVLGTPAYMSPEQARGETLSLDTRSDVYSLGVILFRLLLGEYPHDTSGAYLQCIQRIGREEPRRPRSLDPRLDAELEAILLKALGREPDERYASAGALADDIGRCLSGDVVLARPQTTIYFLRKRIHRYRWQVAAASVIAGMAIAGLAYYIHSNNERRRIAEDGFFAQTKERQIAQLNATRAEEQRRLALRTLNDLVFAVQRELSQGLADVKLRDKLIGIAMAGLQRVTEAAEVDDPAAARSMAAALVQVGDIQALAGKLAEARAAYEQALRRFLALADNGSGGAQSTRDLLITHTRLGRTSLQMGDAERAVLHLEKAKAIAQPHGSGTPEQRLDLWAILITLGDAARTGGEASAGLSAYEEAARILESDSGQARERRLTTRRIAAARLDLAGAEGNWAEQRLEIDRSIAADRAALKHTPDDPRAMHELAVGLSLLGQIELRLNDAASARASLQEACELLRTLLARTPGRFDLKLELGSAGLQLGDAFAAAAHWPDALRSYDEAIALLTPLIPPSTPSASPRLLALHAQLQRSRAAASVRITP